MVGEPSSSERTLVPGIEGSVSTTVTGDMTAAHVGSGSVAVLATPEAVALVERAAVAAVEGRLPPGRTSVGSAVSIDHSAATAIGVRVTATVRLDAVDGRALRFAFRVTDPAGEVARGTHVRVVVDGARFEERAAERARPSAAGRAASEPS